MMKEISMSNNYINARLVEIAEKSVDLSITPMLLRNFNWHNVYGVLRLERELKEQRQLPWYMGFSHFSNENEFVVFKPWPIYYKKSWHLRMVQLRRRIGRFIQNIGNRIAQ